MGCFLSGKFFYFSISSILIIDMMTVFPRIKIFFVCLLMSYGVLDLFALDLGCGLLTFCKMHGAGLIGYKFLMIVFLDR